MLWMPGAAQWWQRGAQQGLMQLLFLEECHASGVKSIQLHF